MSDQRIRVLLVEDNEADQIRVQNLLAEADPRAFVVDCQAGFEAALEAIGRDRYDVALVALNPDSHHGLPFIQEVASSGSATPCVLITAFADRDVDIAASQVGAAGYLDKNSLDAPSLERAIRYAVGGRRFRIQQGTQAILDSLERLSSTRPPAPVTAKLFQGGTLAETCSAAFEDFVQCYAELLDLALERRAYKVEHKLSDPLHALGERLGALRAGPRDVVEIHCAALRKKTSGVAPEKAFAYSEEGSLLVLELMGFLTSYYRNYALGFRRGPPRPHESPHPAERGQDHG